MSKLRSDEEEARDQADEAAFWDAYQGKTDCFGTVAKLALLLAIFIQSLVNAV